MSTERRRPLFTQLSRRVIKTEHIEIAFERFLAKARIEGSVPLIVIMSKPVSHSMSELSVVTHSHFDSETTLNIFREIMADWEEKNEPC